MDDALLVSRAIAGDLDSFGQLYDRYFNRIYDFCWRVTRDADEATVAGQEVFMIAMQGLPGLAKAPSFASWIFTIAHDTAVTRAERAGATPPLPVPSHDEAFGTFDVPDPSRLDDPALAGEDHELAGFIWEAASSLNPRDYALLDLHVRQGLESAEIAHVLNVGKGNAQTLVTRMKAAAGAVIGSYIVARRGSNNCDDLRHALAESGFPPFSDDVRRTVDAHVAGCEACQRSRRALGAPLRIFASFAAVPAPFALKGDFWRDLSASWPYADGGLGSSSDAGFGDGDLDRAHGDALAAAAAAGGAGGGSGGLALGIGNGGDGGNRIVLFAVAVLGLLVFAFAIAGGVILAGSVGGGDGGGSNDGGGRGATRTAIARTPSTPGVVVETPTIDLTPSVTPTPEPETETPIPAPDTPTPEPATETPTLEADAHTPTRTPLAFRTPIPTQTSTPEAAATPTPVQTP